MENTQKMSAQEALNLVAQVAAIYKGTLQEHTSLQQAVQTLNELVTKTEETTKDEDKK